MGAGVSDLAAGMEAGKVLGAGLGELPELCAAEVLLHLDAPDICRLARLNRAFRGAAAANFVWEAKLPENYGYLLGFVNGAKDGEGEGGRRSVMGKKEVYARLAKAVPFDGGKKELWLEKSKGGVCIALSSRSLVITGVDDRRYWNLGSTRLHICSKSGGLRWSESSNSASQQGHTVSTSGFILGRHPHVSVTGFAAPSRSMAGTGSLCASSYLHQMASMPCPSAT